MFFITIPWEDSPLFIGTIDNCTFHPWWSKNIQGYECYILGGIFKVDLVCPD
jgi:hypothetical protein